ncbi:MAG: hypothetical protein ABI193_02215 [Minicystis sp.]
MLAIKSPAALAETEAKPLALRWIGSAMAALDEGELRGERGPASDLLLAALQVSFAWGKVPVGERLARARRIKATYAMIEEMLRLSAHRFRDASEAEARVFFPEPLPLPPSFTRFGRFILFTPAFRALNGPRPRVLGPCCRAAIVLHEAVHLFDEQSSLPSTHVSEWDEPRFSMQSPEEAIHNPSAYASFAAQVHHERIEWPVQARFGLGRAEE